MNSSKVRFALDGIALTVGFMLLGLAITGSLQPPPAPPLSLQAVADDAITERAALMAERDALRQQVADLILLLERRDSDGPASRRVAEGGAQDAYRGGTQAGEPRARVNAAMSLDERLRQVEICLVEANPQEAGLILETMLFQLTFRPVKGQAVTEAASMVAQVLGAIAADDVEKAAYYVEQVRSRL